jgi:ferritin-like metal-binding protein YciE
MHGAGTAEPRNPEEGGNTMSLDSLKDLYVEQLKDLYSAENQILKALPMMAEKASSPELKAASRSTSG